MAIFFIKGMEAARRCMPKKKDLYLSADDFDSPEKCPKKNKKRFLFIRIANKIKNAVKMK